VLIESGVTNLETLMLYLWGNVLPFCCCK